MMLVLPSQRLPWEFSKSNWCFVFSIQFFSSTYTSKSSTCSPLPNEHSQSGIFPNRIWTELSRIAFSLMRFVSGSFEPWSRPFVGINNTSVFCLAFPNIAVGFSTALYRYFARHCCLHRNFQLSTSGFHCELEFFVVWFNEEYSSQLSGIVELWLLDSPSLFSFLLRCIRDTLPHIWPYIVGSWGRLFLVSLPPDHVYPSGDLSFSSTILMYRVHASDNSLSPSHAPTIINIFLHHYIKWCIYVVLVTSMHLMGIGNVSSLGTDSLTLGSTWWRQMKSPVIVQKSFPASASSSVESSWTGVGEESPSDSPRRTSWSSQTSVSSRDFECTIFDWEYEIVTFHRRQHFLCIENSGVDVWCVHLLQFFNVCDHNVSFSTFLPHTMHKRGIYLARLLDQIDAVYIYIGLFAETVWYSTIAPNGMAGPKNGTLNRLSYGVFPSDKRSWIFRR